jgi:hypothetical protein
MTRTQPLDDDQAVRTGLDATYDIALNPRTHGRSRVPGRTAPQFDLDAFSRALERRDAAYQLSCYAPDADIRIVDPDNPPLAPRVVRGAGAIRTWLAAGLVRELDLHVTHLVDGGDRVAFTTRWRYQDAVEGQATSTAELQDGLITSQHTILVWGQNWS